MEKNKKHGIIIGISSLLLVTLILLGLTYAYYKTRIVGNTNEKSISVESKNLSVTYQNESAVINAEGIEPGYTATKTFEVTNTGSESVNYSVMLDNVTNTFTRLEDWTYTISESGNELKSGTLPNSDSYILYSESIDAGATKSYTLVIDYAYLKDVDQSDDMGASLSFRINISDSLGTTLTSATEGTLLYAINRDNVVSEPLTIPGQAASLETEAVLAPTEDDYGTSYYFRGSVGNNYVNYSGMCWRIVRVQGDGTIKLALADENGECNAETYSTDNTTSAFIDGRADIAYKSSMSGNTTDIPFETSDIPDILSDWKSSKNLDTSKLVDAEWCNDTAKTSFDEDESEYGYYGYSYYGAHDRLSDISTANPTLKCNTKGMEGTEGIEAESQKYTSKIAILTADEVAFAGFFFSYSSLVFENKSYLSTNVSGGYWTMSPISCKSSEGLNWSETAFVKTNYIYSNTVVNEGSIRPSIVLSSNVTISSGDGTNANPYVIS